MSRKEKRDRNLCAVLYLSKRQYFITIGGLGTDTEQTHEVTIFFSFIYI